MRATVMHGAHDLRVETAPDAAYRFERFAKRLMGIEDAVIRHRRRDPRFEGRSSRSQVAAER